MKINYIKTPKWFVNCQNPLIILYIMYMIFSFVHNKLWLQPDFHKETLQFLFLFLALFLFHVYYHEYTHYVTAKSFGYRAKVLIDRKNNIKLCIVKGLIRPPHFFLIAAMPLLIDLLIAYSLILLFPTQSLLVGLFIVMGISGATSDIWLFTSSLKFFKKNHYLKYVSEGKFEVIKLVVPNSEEKIS